MVSGGHFTPCVFSCKNGDTAPHLLSIPKGVSPSSVPGQQLQPVWSQCPPPAPMWFRGFLTNTQKHRVERKKMAPWSWPGLQPLLGMDPVTGCFSGVWGWFALSYHYGAHINFDLSLFLAPLKLLLSQSVFGVASPSWCESQGFVLLRHLFASLHLFSTGM